MRKYYNLKSHSALKANMIAEKIKHFLINNPDQNQDDMKKKNI